MDKKELKKPAGVMDLLKGKNLNEKQMNMMKKMRKMEFIFYGIMCLTSPSILTFFIKKRPISTKSILVVAIETTVFTAIWLFIYIQKHKKKKLSEIEKLNNKEVKEKWRYN